jgi:hypothetical protein
MLFRKKYDTTIKLIDSNNIIALRSRVKVLIVDDDKNLGIVDNLIQRKYDIYYKSDMCYPIEAEPFDIVILDIRGIANNLGSSMEGFALAKDIKKRYPNKQVICFSSTLKAEIAEEIHKLDGFIKKDYTIEKWVDRLDQSIKDYLDINKQWVILEKQLTDNCISKSDINIIKDEYYNSFKIKSFDKLDTVLMGTIKNTKLMIEVFQSIMSLLKLLSV